MKRILIVPIYPVENEIVHEIAEPLGKYLNIDISIDKTNNIDLLQAYDVLRGQYNSTKIISLLLDKFSNFDGKILGIISVDLFIPVLTFVFGEAQLYGKIAIVSTYRLDDRIYGLPPNPTVLKERLIKEAIHELGHTFGLVHCKDYLCVMKSSTTVEEIDLKSANFCSECKAKLEERNKLREKKPPPEGGG